VNKWTTDTTIFVIWCAITTGTGMISWYAMGWWFPLSTLAISYGVAMIGALEVKQTTERERARCEAILITLEVLERGRQDRRKGVPDANAQS
jgi:hypothetical protein